MRTANESVFSFVRDSILNEREFEWESQLRFYWDKEPDELIVRQCTGKIFLINAFPLFLNISAVIAYLYNRSIRVI